MSKEAVSILIVDDDKTNRFILNRFCSVKIKKPVEIIEAENGIIATQLAVEKKVDIIVMDYNMPGINGAEAIKIIKEKGWNGIAIGYTGNKDKDVEEQFTKAGAEVVFIKPEGLSDLVKVIVDKIEVL